MAGRKAPKTGTVTKVGQVVGRGDTKKVIPPDEVAKLAKLHCTNTEIAEYFGVPVATLEYNFAEIITKAKSETKQALRRAQLSVAMGGNVTMLIWLGKQMLGQREPGPAALLDNTGAPIQIEFINTGE